MLHVALVRIGHGRVQVLFSSLFLVMVT